jgi:hypothetical protein
MTIELLRGVLLWCALINVAILLTSFGVFTLARDRLHRHHQRWFRLTGEQLDAQYFTVWAMYKYGIILFNLVPWIALHIVA